MPAFLSPEVAVSEVKSKVVVAKRFSPNVTALAGTTPRGPINRPQSVSSLVDYVNIYGEDDGGYMYQSMVGFFKNGGERAIINRIAHYTAINDLDTLTAISSEVELLTEGDTDTPAVKTTTIPGPWNFSQEAGVNQPPTLIASIDGQPNSTVQIDVTPSSVLAAGVPAGIGTAATTLTFNVMGVPQIYVVPGAPPTTAVEWALSIASQINGSYGAVNAGKVQLFTVKKGSIADIDYVGATGNAGTQSGFGAGPIAGINPGPNDVPDHSNITDTELAPIIQADWSGGGGVTAINLANDNIEVSSNTLGSAGSIGAVSGTAASKLAFTPAGLVSGIDAGSPGIATLLIRATSEGEHGNELSITTKRVDKAVSTVAENMNTVNAPFDYMTVKNKSQLRIGLQIKVVDSVTTGMFRAIIKQIIGLKIYFENPVTPTANIVATNNPQVIKETFNLSVNVGDTNVGNYYDLSMSLLDVVKYVEYVIGNDPILMDPTLRIYALNQNAVISNTKDPRPVDIVNAALIGGIDSDPVVNQDYIGSELTMTGLQAFNTNKAFSLLCIPGVDNAEVHNAIEDYVNSRLDHLAMMDAPEDLTPVQIVDYKNVTANLFSTYTVLNCGRIRVRRESTGQIENFPNTGYVLGMFARNDKNFSISEPPAGGTKAQIFGVFDIANNNEYQDKKKRDIVYPEGINPIFSLEGTGPVYYGQNLTDTLSEINVIGVRRAFIFIRRTIAQLAEGILFTKNTSITRKNFTTTVAGFLREQYRKNVIDGRTEQEAFYIVCDEGNNPPDLIAAKGFYAKIGVNILPGIENALIEIEKINDSLVDQI